MESIGKLIGFPALMRQSALLVEQLILHDEVECGTVAVALFTSPLSAIWEDAVEEQRFLLQLPVRCRSRICSCRMAAGSSVRPQAPATQRMLGVRIVGNVSSSVAQVSHTAFWPTPTAC